MEIKHITAPMSAQTAAGLKAGDQVFISGILYTARDAAHKRMVEDLAEGRPLPFDLKDQIIFYMGPCPAKPGEVIGPAGPTTSHRMDAYTPVLLDHGLTGMIGKGNRTAPVIESIAAHHAVYFACVGGTGTLCARCITASEVIAYPDLGTEAVRRLAVKDFPVIVVIDAEGHNLYESERLKYINEFSKLGGYHE